MNEPVELILDRLIDTASSLGRATNERDHSALAQRISNLRDLILSRLPVQTRTLSELLNQQPHDT